MEDYGKIRQVLEEGESCPYPVPQERPAPQLGPYKAVIAPILEEDRQAPRKQHRGALRGQPEVSFSDNRGVTSYIRNDSLAAGWEDAAMVADPRGRGGTPRGKDRLGAGRNLQLVRRPLRYL